MYRLFACLCTIVLLSGFRSPPPLPGPVVLSIIDREQGLPLPQYPHRGQRWIEGQPGHRYSIGLHNRSGQRVLVVVSVDGINAITGADATPAQSGYVLDPGERAEINGWRKSSTEVAQFVFTDNGDSYASRSGRPANVGVIGIAVFNEARPRPAPLADRLRDAAAAARMPAAAEAGADRAAMQSEGNSARQQLGTGHGRRESSVVATTGFERASTLPVQISELRYDAAARLVALGVVRTRLPPSPPRAFPGGFVPDPPPRWR